MFNILVRRRIFESFFTTKTHGHGLDMSAVYGIVKNHDGWITVESKKEKGTTVTAAFPAIRLDLEKQHSAGIMQ
ncbi:MAG: ATP-binding protein [Desulfobacterales bacterium]